MASKKKVVNAPDDTLELAPQVVPVAPELGQDPATWTPAQELYKQLEKQAEVAKAYAAAGLPVPVSQPTPVQKNSPKVPVAPVPKVAVSSAAPSTTPLAVPPAPNAYVIHAQAEAEAYAKAAAQVVQENQKVLDAKKAASAVVLAPVDVASIAARVQDKLESAAQAQKVAAEHAEQIRLAEALAPIRKDAQRELAELKAALPDREALLPVLSWDAATMERRKLMTGVQAGRYRGAQDVLLHVPRFISQLEEAIRDMDQLPSSGLKGRHLQQELKQIAAVCGWSIGAGYNTRSAIRSLRTLLLELDGSTLKAAPHVESTGHAALAALAHGPAAPIQTTAVVDFNP